MTVPVIAAQRFGAGLVLGMLLGLWHGFLRPVRQRFGGTADFLFLVGFGWAKPVPVDMRYFKKPKLGMAIASLAAFCPASFLEYPLPLPIVFPSTST